MHHEFILNLCYKLLQHAAIIFDDTVLGEFCELVPFSKFLSQPKRVQSIPTIKFPGSIRVGTAEVMAVSFQENSTVFINIEFYYHIHFLVIALTLANWSSIIFRIVLSLWKPKASLTFVNW